MSFLMQNDGPKDDSDEESSKSTNKGPPSKGQDESKKEIPEEKKPPLPTTSSSLIKFYPTWCTCFDQKLEYTRPDNATCKQNCAYFFKCPPRGPLAKITVFLSIFILCWFILYLLVGGMAGLKGPIMSIIVLEILGLFLGLLVKAFGCPALLAPLALGIVLRNVPELDLFKNFQYPYHTWRKENNTLLKYCTAVLNYNESNPIQYAKCCNHYKLLASSHWINPIREIALTLILTRAGLELSPKQLKKLSGLVPALAFIPCIVEACTCAALFYGFFYELGPNIWMCGVAGFALAAVSPAVVVPGVLSLSRKGLGVAKGIPTLLIAASSIDDVLAITLYTICLSLAPSSTYRPAGQQEICLNPYVEKVQEVEYSSLYQIIGSVCAIALGIVVGVILGCILHFIPSRESKSKSTQRLIMLLIINITCVLGFERTEIVKGAGSIAVLTTSFVASFGWRSQHNWKPVMHDVEHKLAHIWAIFVPILFGTIGKEIKFATEKGADDPYDVEVASNDRAAREMKLKYWNPFDGINIARIIGIILICLLVRCGTTFMIGKFAGFNLKERLFVALAWIPKATVQAALAPLVLSAIVEKEHTVKMMCQAKAIVAMAVFGIIITAPIGAICIKFTGPCLLKVISPDEIEEEFPNGEAASIDSTEHVMKPSPSKTRSNSDSFYSIENFGSSTTSITPVVEIRTLSGTQLEGEQRKPSFPKETKPPGTAALQSTTGSGNVGVRSGVGETIPATTTK